VTTPIPDALADILDQAREVRERYPAFHAFLATRERAIERARRGIPHPGDAEAWLSFNASEHIRRHLLHIPPGICELARLAEQRDAVADGRAS
jgi:hypothetical protein